MKKNLKYNAIWLAIAVLGWVLINVFEGVGIIDQFAENTLVLIGINIILATGLNLIIGFSGQFSLGHAGFMALGAYAAALVTQAIPTEGGFVLGTVIGMLLAGVVALIIGIPTLRLKGDYLAIATMGAAEIIRIILVNLKITNGPAGLYGLPQLANWSLVYILVVVTTIFTVNFIHSRNGRAILSVRKMKLPLNPWGSILRNLKLPPSSLGA
ncbi:branched-chain amino acid transport system permease protein LivM [Agrilactobacillus composti DSM 18527 = JCM 14202]|nr:branched-chain amino acid transport system permease protein LivM [Agrilactobacillus composti DSM 18527 = JCM 14202]